MEIRVHIQIAYLSQCTRSDGQIVQHPEGNHECGGKCEPPAESITPPRVLQCVVELQWSVFDQGENKCCLKNCNGKGKYSLPRRSVTSHGLLLPD